MMFLIGQGERIQVIGPPETRHCPNCDQERGFLPQLKYSYGQFDVLFGFVYGRRYQLACPHCNHGWLLDAQTARQTYGPAAIPFHLKYGAWMLAGLVAVVGSAAYAYRHWL